MYNSYEAFGALFAALGSLMLVFIFIILAVVVFLAIVKWKMFAKAGKPGWASIVPIYNYIVLFDIIGYKWYYIFFLSLNLIPIIGTIALILFNISYNIKLAKSFGQSVGFGIGLFLVPIVFMAIIAFDDSIQYKGQVVDGDIDFGDLF